MVTVLSQPVDLPLRASQLTVCLGNAIPGCAAAHECRTAQQGTPFAASMLGAFIKEHEHNESACPAYKPCRHVQDKRPAGVWGSVTRFQSELSSVHTLCCLACLLTSGSVHPATIKPATCHAEAAQALTLVPISGYRMDSKAHKGYSCQQYTVHCCTGAASAPGQLPLPCSPSYPAPVRQLSDHPSAAACAAPQPTHLVQLCAVQPNTEVAFPSLPPAHCNQMVKPEPAMAVETPAARGPCSWALGTGAAGPIDLDTPAVLGSAAPTPGVLLQRITLQVVPRDEEAAAFVLQGGGCPYQELTCR